MNDKMMRTLFREVKFLRDNGVHKGSGLKGFYDIEVKRLRAALKETDYSGLDMQIVVKNYDDGEMIRFPIGQYPDKETAEIFADMLRIHHVPTWYDCTGQLFTAYQTVHYMAGEWWCWQRNVYDI